MAEILTAEVLFADTTAYRRPPEVVMRLARMGSAHPTRLSFLRTLLRRIKSEGWAFDRPVWQIDEQGVGRAVYRAIGPKRTYSLVAFAHDLPDAMRSDRVIATAWDATFTLFDGTPTPAEIDRLQDNVPLQEAGRISSQELTLARANRSVRLFAHVVDRLAQGRQPDLSEIDAVGYLMRTTAVYGSGKFGAADREAIADRSELRGPFQAEMLSVWLIRSFSIDLVEHLAAMRGGQNAVRLENVHRRRLGVGNATGLGMAPFLIKHPTLLNNWMMVREEALARVRSQPTAINGAVDGFLTAIDDAIANADTWTSKHPIQIIKIAELRADLAQIKARGVSTALNPWNELWLWAEKTLSVEGQEALVAAMLEPHGTLVDGLSDCMDADEAKAFHLDGSVTIARFRSDFTRHYHWVMGVDYEIPDQSALFWYVSEEKLEPRLGHRYLEPGAALELPVDTARRAASLGEALAVWPDDDVLAHFLLAHPEHRFMARRVQQAVRYPYSEIQENLIAADMLPIDILRCKLAFFGASRFDPLSDRWVRIALFQGQPHPADLADETNQ